MRRLERYHGQLFLDETSSGPQPETHEVAHVVRYTLTLTLFSTSTSSRRFYCSSLSQCPLTHFFLYFPLLLFYSLFPSLPLAASYPLLLPLTLSCSLSCSFSCASPGLLSIRRNCKIHDVCYLELVSTHTHTLTHTHPTTHGLTLND